jgi:hypothetical protein
MEHLMRSLIRLLAAAALLACLQGEAAFAQQPQPVPPPGPESGQPRQPQYSTNEILDSGHRFFGTVSRGLAQVVEKAFSQFGQPNGYILGEEAGGAFVAGLRYGEGTLYTKNAGDLRVYWQGPSIGCFGMTALGAGNIVVVPIRAGVGLRLGANIGYLKFTPTATWNPF